MRVTFVGHSARLSGAELFLHGMLQHTELVEASVVLMEHGPLEGRLRDAGAAVEVCPLPPSLAAVRAGGTSSGGRAASLGRTGTYVPQLARTIRSTRPELVYTNSAKAHVLALPTARMLGLPVVMHAHDMVTSSAFSRLNRLLLTSASRHASRVIANSQATLATLSSRASATVMACPTRLPGPSTAAAQPLSIAVVGRISPWKGQHLAVRALEILRAQHPGATLHVYGDALFDADRVYLDDVRHLIRSLHLEEAVHLHGHIDDVSAAMRRHTVVAHTSTRPEPFGQVVIEAMAAGVPVVAADAGGPREVVRPGREGLLYPMGDERALAAALHRIMTDPSLHQALVAGGLERATDYTYERLVPYWESILETTARLR